ncbi:hypothetical protein H0H92_004597 [Tricholoma furcatifolium]|nr:hypothetical protein H0H92_004597 [Tricholoma furcatifolium]
MSTAAHNTNVACCSIPPVHSDYSPKGTFKPFGKFNKVYVTGPEDSDSKIVCVFDIFGFFPQTQQGADIIASALKATVYMPDFFEPHGPFPIDNFPPKTEKEKHDLQNFFGGTASPPAAIKKLTEFGQTLKSSGAKHIGVYGFCWGGKVTISAGGASTPFDAVAIVHPAMLSAADAEKLTVPLAIYPSKDEPVTEGNRFHGWAAARGDLNNSENKKEFKDVYARLAQFYCKVFGKA